MPYRTQKIKKSKLRFKISKKPKRQKTEAEKVSAVKPMLIILPFLSIIFLVVGIYFSFAFFKNEELLKEKENIHDNVSNHLANGEINSDNPFIIVNYKNPLEADYVPKLSEFNGIKVNSEIVSDLQEMIEAAKKDDIILTIKSGYISYEEEQNLYEAEKERLINNNGLSDIKAEAEAKKVYPKGGESETQTGLLLKFYVEDSEGAFSKTKEFNWLESHCVSYGFVLRYPQYHEDHTGMKYNSSVYRYVGKDNAMKIRSYGMCCNEFSSHLNSR